MEILEICLYIVCGLFGLVSIVFSYICMWDGVPSIRRYKLAQKIPGPKGQFLLGFAKELMNLPMDDLLIWLENKFKDYDRIMNIWIIGFNDVFMKEPDDIQVIFNNVEYINKGREYFVIEPWLNKGLLTSTGEKWHTRRKILTPAFHFKILEDNMSIFNKNSRILCEKLQAKEDVTLENVLSLCTLDVIMGTAMGIEIDAQNKEGQKYVSVLRQITDIITYRLLNPRIYSPIIFYLSETGKRFREGVKYLHKFTSDVIAQKRMESSNSSPVTSKRVLKAFLDRMLDYERNYPGSFNDSGIREEVDTFMFEGHDTTSSALVFIFFNLAKYQDVQERVYEELEEIFGSSDRDTTTSDLQSMKYLEMVIKECLRLYPPVPVITRLLQKDLILNDGLIIPAISNISIPVNLVHRNEKYWSDPERFDPERFSDDEIQGRHSYSYIPFSAGPRNCIGQKFAMMELKTVVSTVMRRLQVLPITTSEEIKLVASLILRSSVPIKCKFIKRV